MKEFLYFLLLLIILSLNSACSIQIDQAASPSQNSSQSIDESANIPVTWGNLGLRGELMYIVADFKGGSEKGGLRVALRSLDLATGKVTQIFETEVGSWIRSFAVSPDLKNLIISYAPPSDPLAGPKERLYILRMDGSEPPQLLFLPPTDQDQYTQPEFSPDGKYLYFTHFSSRSSSNYEIMRLAYPDGKLESLIDQAYWSRLSADGSQLAYVFITSANGPNELFVANAEGTDARPIQLLDSGWTQSIIDAPLFLTDGKSILFSAPLPAQSSAPTRWVDKLFGVTVANAHGYIPSDWWSVPLAGGEPVRLTRVYSPGLFASLSADSKFIASYSSSGIFVMDPQGGNLTQIVNYTGGIAGALRWTP
jgi:Tol biopolymer transport system component